VAGDAINIVLDPIFMFVFQYGVSGAAIAHVISQYVHTFCLFPIEMEGIYIQKFMILVLLSFVIVYGGTFCRYFIASILLWRLRLHVDLLPPSFKHLQFGRFLKNGKLFLMHLTPNNL
jgi:hypothetical protein